MSPHAMAIWSGAIWFALRNGPIMVVMRGDRTSGSGVLAEQVELGRVIRRR